MIKFIKYANFTFRNERNASFLNHYKNYKQKFSQNKNLNRDLYAQNLENQIKKFSPTFSNYTKNIANVEIKNIENIGVINFETQNSKINILNFDLCSKLYNAFYKLNNNDKIDTIILKSNKNNSFLNGADLNFLSAIDKESAFLMSLCFQNLIKYIMNSKCTISLVEGDCLGGGLELCLASHYRIGLKEARFGFPESNLGLIPGGLGTLMSQTRCRPHKMRDLIIYGRSIDTQTAYEYKILTHKLEVPSDISPHLVPSLTNININDKHTNNFFIDYLLNSINHLYHTAFKLYDYFGVSNRFFKNENALNSLSLFDFYYQNKEFYKNGSEEYCEFESKLFSELLGSQYFQDQIKVMEKRAKSQELLLDAFPQQNFSPKNFSVIGASGHIGQQISQFIHQDKNSEKITLHDTNPEKLQIFMDEYSQKNSIDKKLKIKNKNLKFEVYHKENDFKKAEIIFESVSENIDAKVSALKFLNSSASDNCIIASTTSALSIEELSKNINRPENFIGVHFMSPLNKMKLVEIIPSKHTSPEVISKTISYLKTRGKNVIVVKDSPGFYTTRVLTSMMSEIFSLYEEAYTPNLIDTELMKFGFGFPISVLMDHVGLDLCDKIHKHMISKLGNKFGNEKLGLLEYLIEKGCTGVKAYEGINVYDNYGKPALLNFYGKRFHEYMLSGLPYVNQNLNHDVVIPRIIYRMLNECAKCLQESVIKTPLDGDIGAIDGFNFPTNLYGPFAYMDHVSTQKVVEYLHLLFESTKNPAFEPCDLLVTMAQNNQKFFN